MITALAAVSPAPSPLMALPFVLLLLCIALLPVFAAHHWERHYAKIALTLAAVTGAWLGLVQRGHALEAIGHSLAEYVAFMALVGSLYIISGGINIRVQGEATPRVNTLFLFVGAVLANVIGTTGASMLLIRPWIRMNRYRITAFHVVFFIFIVSNCGGCLTPIGDPPLFIGFLRGVPFWWVLAHCWPAWALCIALLLGVFFVLDLRNFKRAPAAVAESETAHETWSVRGLRNGPLLLLVLVGVFLPERWQLGVGTFHVTAGSLLMIAAAIVSLIITPRAVHEANDFNFHPVQEVGWLFIGIFITMIPALDWLKAGGGVQPETALQTFFASGALSAFLDNAPTYLAFIAAGMGRHGLDIGSVSNVREFLALHPEYVLATSLGAVFFGAGSYIGNGPNFMVKAIAEKAQVKVPGFLGYVLGYSLPVLLPVLVLIGWLVLRA